MFTYQAKPSDDFQKVMDALSSAKILLLLEKSEIGQNYEAIMYDVQVTGKSWESKSKSSGGQKILEKQILLCYPKKETLVI